MQVPLGQSCCQGLLPLLRARADDLESALGAFPGGPVHQFFMKNLPRIQEYWTRFDMLFGGMVARK